MASHRHLEKEVSSQLTLAASVATIDKSALMRSLLEILWFVLSRARTCLPKVCGGKTTEGGRQGRREKHARAVAAHSVRDETTVKEERRSSSRLKVGRENVNQDPFRAAVPLWTTKALEISVRCRFLRTALRSKKVN